MTTDPDTLRALVERIEAAEAGSRILDKDIAEAIGLRAAMVSTEDSDPWVLMGPRGVIGPLPHLTSSLDAALTLVPEGWGGCIFLSGAARLTRNPPGLGEVCRSLANNETPRAAEAMVVGAADNGSPALALCAAALRARIEGEEG